MAELETSGNIHSGADRSANSPSDLSLYSASLDPASLPRSQRKPTQRSSTKQSTAHWQQRPRQPRSREPATLLPSGQLKWEAPATPERLRYTPIESHRGPGHSGRSEIRSQPRQDGRPQRSAGGGTDLHSGHTFRSGGQHHGRGDGSLYSTYHSTSAGEASSSRVAYADRSPPLPKNLSDFVLRSYHEEQQRQERRQEHFEMEGSVFGYPSLLADGPPNFMTSDSSEMDHETWTLPPVPRQFMGHQGSLPFGGRNLHRPTVVNDVCLTCGSTDQSPSSHWLRCEGPVNRPMKQED
ncbi:hypothetical protein DFP72DRAFT_1142744 [Ephemerocybe angulata]|uniref:Uncharacterized protein n=1 Tax=Ephemerocybe angulata TaxID=980116 RepID=A0A8H6M1X1_9AGAR|nr:hypothetical protein DFP72DRAFT_1152383 [Tulosesus angulatus]KAF6749241.1 hypothetical protein DFP72DRAFT_1142744 [Tulosesus angulatus]